MIDIFFYFDTFSYSGKYKLELSMPGEKVEGSFIRYISNITEIE